MKFTKEFLIDQRDRGYIDEGEDGRSRWSIHCWGVFEHKGKFYRTVFSVGATECQDERPYEYDDDDIECPEVKKVPVIVEEWKPV